MKRALLWAGLGPIAFLGTAAWGQAHMFLDPPLINVMEGNCVAVTARVENVTIPLRGYRVIVPCNASGGVAGSVSMVPPATVNRGEPNYVFAGNPSADPQINDLNCPFMSPDITNMVLTPPFPIFAVPKYLGEFIFCASSGAAGDFNVQIIDEGPLMSGLVAPDFTPIPFNRTGAVIRVNGRPLGKCCLNSGTPGAQCLDGITQSACATLGSNDWTSDDFCTGDPVVDCPGGPACCVPGTGGCVEATWVDGTGTWSTPTHWFPRQIPNNGPPGSLYLVTIAGAVSRVTLDLNVTIDSLQLFDKATLRLAGPEPGNLEIATTCGLQAQGSLLTSENRQINVFGPITFGSGGIYQKDPMALPPVSASLNAASITLLPTDRSVQMRLSHQMSVHTSDYFLMTHGGGPVAQGGKTDPITRLTDGATLDVDGDLILIVADLQVDAGATVFLGGDLNNQVVTPGTFNWVNGKINPDGSSPQMFEVAGKDVGATASGFTNNFAMGEVNIAPASTVTFVDNFDNDMLGQGPCTEALYVGRLVFGVGSSVTLNNCRVYYVELVDNGVVPTLVGCAQMTPISKPGPTVVARGPRALGVTPVLGATPVALLVVGDAGDPNVSCLSRYVQLDGTLDSGAVFQLPVAWGTVIVRDTEIIPDTLYSAHADYGSLGTPDLSVSGADTTWMWPDVTHDGFVNIDDVLCLLDEFGGVPNACDPESLDIMPCVQDGFVNLDDVLAPLNVFAGGGYPCADPCP